MVAVMLTLDRLSDDEERKLNQLLTDLEALNQRNQVREAYYRGRQRVRNLGISLPDAQAQLIDVVVGWPEIAVDVVEERLDLDSFSHPTLDLDALGLPEVLARNRYMVESSQAHLDSLIYGVEFGCVSDGDDDEPHPLITFEPPTRMTAEWDARKRRIIAAALFAYDTKSEVRTLVRGTLFLDDVTIVADRTPGGWKVVDRQEHGRGRPAVVRFVNRPRTGRQWGSSEITRAVMSATDTAVRTVLGMEVHREFFSSPQRYALGVGENAFTDPSGAPIPAWEALLGRVWALESDQDGNAPTVGQFPATSPASYIEQLKGIASLFAASSAIPITYLGFHTQNPPGGDGIRASEARLVKRAERRQSTLGGVHADLAALAIQIRDGSAAPDLSKLTAVWRDAATPTKAATADATVKYVAAGILPPQSEVTWEMMGLDATTRARLAADVRRARAQELVTGLRTAADGIAVAGD